MANEWSSDLGRFVVNPRFDKQITWAFGAICALVLVVAQPGGVIDNIGKFNHSQPTAAPTEDAPSVAPATTSSSPIQRDTSPATLGTDIHMGADDAAQPTIIGAPMSDGQDPTSADGRRE